VLLEGKNAVIYGDIGKVVVRAFIANESCGWAPSLEVEFYV
jgi:hypothetical protein